MTSLVNTALTIAISAAGGLVGHLCGIPAGWLMGGALAVAIAGLAGVRVMLPPLLSNAALVMTGVAMGASVARDSLQLMMQWPVTLAALVLELLLIIVVTGFMLRRFFGVDRGTAYLSSFPGHLALILGIAAAGVGNPRQITVIQVLRVLLLTTVVPIGAMFLPVGHDVALATNEPPIGWGNLAVVVGLCIIAGVIFDRLKVPAAYALGAMAAAIIAKFSGNFDGSMPGPVLIGTYIMIGALIGSRFATIELSEFREALTGGVIATAVTIGIVTAVSYGAATLVDMPFGQIWLGLAPGALEGMGSLGIALGFDTAFIAAHHVARLLMLIAAVPVVVLLVRETERNTTEGVQ